MLLVYFTLDDSGHVLARFSKFRIWDKFPKLSRPTLILGDTCTLSSLKHNVA